MATRITVHAQKRMTARSISFAQVQAVLDAPETYRDDPDQRSVRLERAMSEGLLRVWVVAPWPDGDRVVVKSVAWKD